MSHISKRSAQDYKWKHSENRVFFLYVKTALWFLTLVSWGKKQSSIGYTKEAEMSVVLLIKWTHSKTHFIEHIQKHFYRQTHILIAMVYTCICLQMLEGYFLWSLEYFRKIHANRELLTGHAPTRTEPNLQRATFNCSKSGKDPYFITYKQTCLQDHQYIFIKQLSL